MFMATITTIVILATISAMSLYWSSLFRRSVHATAVSYVTVIVMTVVTFIIFVIGMSIHQGGGWETLPYLLKAPLYFNPYFFLTMAFVPASQLYPEWTQCLAVFLLLGTVSAILTLRNLRRGELV